MFSHALACAIASLSALRRFCWCMTVCRSCSSCALSFTTARCVSRSRHSDVASASTGLHIQGLVGGGVGVRRLTTAREKVSSPQRAAAVGKHRAERLVLPVDLLEQFCRLGEP